MIELNDKIWKILYKFMSPVSDNLAMIIIFYTTLFFLIMLILKLLIIKKYSLGIPEFIFTLSLGEAVIRTPMVHERVHLALSITSNFIMESKEFLQTFSNVSNFIPRKTVDVASYIYYLPVERQSIFSNAEPHMLYNSVFRTLNSICNVGSINLRDSSFFTFSFIFLLSIFIIVVSFNKDHLLSWYIFSILILCSSIKGNGVLLIPLTFVVLATSYYNLIIVINKIREKKRK